MLFAEMFTQHANRKDVPICTVNAIITLTTKTETCLSKQCRPRSDVAERDVWSGSPLFATHAAVFIHINI